MNRHAALYLVILIACGIARFNACMAFMKLRRLLAFRWCIEPTSIAGGYYPKSHIDLRSTCRLS